VTKTTESSIESVQ